MHKTKPKFVKKYTKYALNKKIIFKPQILKTIIIL